MPFFTNRGIIPLPGGGGGGTGLRTNMSSYWEFESGSWLDSHGSNTLTGSGTPTSVGTAPAVVGNYVNLVAASSQVLSVATTANLEVGNSDFSIALWAYANSFPDGNVITKTAGFGDREFEISTAFTSGNQFRFTVFTNTGSTGTNCDAATFGGLSTGTWYFVACTYTNSTNTATISVRTSGNTTGTRDSAVASSPPIVTSSGPVRIGNNSGAAFWDGRADQVGYWKGRVLSAGDEVLLYNAGAGLSYAGTA